MSSDADYAAFLDKANQDTGAGDVSAQSHPSSSVRTKAVNTEVPQTLQAVEEYYVSDADEPFEPVSLKWDGDALPGKGMIFWICILWAVFISFPWFLAR